MKWFSKVGDSREDEDETAEPQLTRFGLEGGEVEVFPGKPEYHLDEHAEANTLAARDSLALQEVGDAVNSKQKAEEFDDDDDDDDDDDVASTESKGRNVRKRLRIALLLFVLLAIILATVFTRDNRKNRGGNLEPAVVSGAELDTNMAPSPSPSSSPTSALELTLEFQLLKPYVEPPSKLLDPASPQSKAFQQILSENINEEDFGFRVKQRFAMMVVYYAMGGEDWSWRSGWSNFSEDECEWHGVAICRYRDGRRVVAGLQLPSNNVTGGVPEEICLLEGLESLLIGNNELAGELPECLTRLLSMFEVDVHNNKLTGQPPSGFLGMPRLEYLDLSSNSFSGGLNFLDGVESRSDTSPTFQSRLTTLKLDNNSFEGEIPEAVYDLDSLQELTLHDTSVTGDVSSICQKPSVSVLSADCTMQTCDEDCCQCL